MGAAAVPIALMGTSVGLGMFGNYMQMKGMEAQNRLAQFQYAQEAKWSRFQAKQARKKGQVAYGRAMSDMEQLTSTQRLYIGAQGIDPKSGSAASAILEDRMRGEMDAIEIKNNANLQALGFEADALSSESAARMAQANFNLQMKLAKIGMWTGAGSQLASFGASYYAKGPNPGKTAAATKTSTLSSWEGNRLSLNTRPRPFNTNSMFQNVGSRPQPWGGWQMAN